MHAYIHKADLYFISMALPSTPDMPDYGVSLPGQQQAERGHDSRLVHAEHNVCIFLGPPHAGHLLRFVTSFKALPAICLCLFFMCDVFFLGTALRMPSHMSPSNEGMLEIAAGIAMAREGIEGNGGCCICCEDRIADLKGEPNAGDESRGKSIEKAEAIRSCCRAAIVIESSVCSFATDR
ncbi:hypothetical protein F4803DRAFT_442964 [Xylaria telfairii]|nr:hypothetical protein F4803DRAFT_442964 [Xylaria telfairii]